MATSTKTLKTRIQLKSDTEANWNKAGPKDGSNGFVPLLGELIVYNADTTHPFSRLKVGDGSTNVVDLPFIDAGTLNGEETEIVKKENFTAFPSPGSETQLYVDLSTNKIYHYAANSGYTLLSDIKLDVSKTSVGSVTFWSAGVPATATLENNVLKLSNGISPRLDWYNQVVVTDVTKG